MMYEFRIYIVGGSKNSTKTIEAIENLEKLFKSKLGNNYTLNIVDILENHSFAQKDGIFATPTIVKVNPPPNRKVLGDLSNGERVLALLLM